MIRTALIRRPRRLKTALIFLAVMTLVSALARALWSNGVFSSVPTGFEGSCKVVGHLPGVQDMEAADGMVFIAASSARGPSAEDGIYAYPLSGGALIRLAGAPKDFHPRGLGLLRDSNGAGLFLMAVNHRTGMTVRAGATNNTGRFSIDSFKVSSPAAAPALVPQGTIESGLLTNPQDVAAVGPNNFYVANGAGDSNPLLHLGRTYGLLSGGNLLYFNGSSFIEAAGGLYEPRSLILTGEGAHLVVAGLLNRSLTSFNVEPFSGVLTEGGNLTLPTAPDRLSMAAGGGLFVAGHARLTSWRAFAADPQRSSPSQVLRVGVAGGVPQQATQIYGNDGSQIGGASVAVSANGHLLIGSSLDGRLLDCISK